MTLLRLRAAIAALGAVGMVAFAATPAVAETTTTTMIPTSTTTPATGTSASTSTTVAPTTSTVVPAVVPATVPVITEPLDAASVAGNATITATSSAPSLQFYIDGFVFGTPVSVVAGSASTSWPTWGLEGPHVLTAADCDTGCNVTQSTPVNVTVMNVAPVVTTPTNGSSTSTSVTFHANTNGGGLNFVVDGVQQGFDGTAPYALTATFPAGTHEMHVTECDVSGITCNGPDSADVSFVVKVLHPTVSSGSPNPFSPHHDGRGDQTSFHIHLPDTEHVSFSIRNVNNTIVSGPHTPGALAAGDHIVHWDGKTNAGKIAGDGTFTLHVDTTRTVAGITYRGTASGTVRVDDTPTYLSNITGNGFTFYPVIDGYIDKFGPKVSVSEGGGLWLEIYNSAGTKVREYAKPHGSKGTISFSWDGRTAGGSMLKAGTYRYFFKAQDAAGNQSHSGNYQVNLRHEHLINKTATLTRNGEDGIINTTDTDCTQYSYGLSEFAHGVWLDNFCDPGYDGNQAIFADYNLTAPGAVRYNTIRVRTYGNTINEPEPIGALIYNWSSRDWNTVGAVNLTNENNNWSNYGTVGAAGRVSPGRIVKVSIGVGDYNPPEDYDIGFVEVTVSYSVLGL